MTEAHGPNTLLRHTLATLAYRAAKTLRDAPPRADIRAGHVGRQQVPPGREF